MNDESVRAFAAAVAADEAELAKLRAVLANVRALAEQTIESEPLEPGFAYVDAVYLLRILDGQATE